MADAGRQPGTSSAKSRLAYFVMVTLLEAGTLAMLSP